MLRSVVLCPLTVRCGSACASLVYYMPRGADLLTHDAGSMQRNAIQHRVCRSWFPAVQMRRVTNLMLIITIKLLYSITRTINMNHSYHISNQIHASSTLLEAASLKSSWRWNSRMTSLDLGHGICTKRRVGEQGSDEVGQLFYLEVHKESAIK